MKISDIDCAVVQTALRRGRTGPAEESHLFRCRSCRAEARILAAWKGVAPPEASERRVEADEGFVAGVLSRVRGERRRRVRQRIGLAAAAALLFFFAAGLSENATAAGTAGSEDEYAQMLAPSLGALLPE
jgi:hypothetical protein